MEMVQPVDPGNPSDGGGVKGMASRFETASQHTSPLQQRPLDPVLTLAPRKPVKVAAGDVLAAATAQSTPTMRSLDPVLSTSLRPPVRVAAEAVVAAGSRKSKMSRSLDPVLVSSSRQPVKVTAEAVLTQTPPRTPAVRKLDPVLSSSSRAHVKDTAALHETFSTDYKTKRYLRGILPSKSSDCSSPPSSSSFSDRSSICSVSSSNSTSPPTSHEYLSPPSSLESISDRSKSFEPGCEITEDELNCFDDASDTPEQRDIEEHFFLKLPGEDESIVRSIIELDRKNIQPLSGNTDVRVRRLSGALPNRFLGTKSGGPAVVTGELVDRVMSVVSAASYTSEDNSDGDDEYDIFTSSTIESHKIIDCRAVEHDAFVIEDADVRVAIERAEENRIRDMRNALVYEKRPSFTSRSGEMYIV